MPGPRDRIEDYKDAIRRAAISAGCNESKVAATLASFIIRGRRPRSPFLKRAMKTLESVRTLEEFTLKHRKDYVDLRRSTENERDSIEREVTVFVKACKDQVDVLKNSIADEGEEEGSKGLFSLSRSRTENRDAVAHKHGVVLILSEKLHSVTSKFDELRAARFRDAIERSAPRRRKANLPVLRSFVSSDMAETHTTMELDDDAPSLKLQEQKQHLFEDETLSLQVELGSLLDSVHATETKMVEMSALNHLMATHVMQQSQQIELLYEQALKATRNVELGNKELSQAIERNKSSRTLLLLFLSVLTFSVLFLDWYS